jgi:hypothetical protein
LAFGINRVEGKGGFAGTAQSRDYNQSIARNFEIEILEVMLARTLDNDAIHLPGSVD